MTISYPENAILLDKKCQVLLEYLCFLMSMGAQFSQDVLIENLLKQFEMEANLSGGATRWNEFSSTYLQNQYLALNKEGVCFNQYQAYNCSTLRLTVALRLHTKYCPEELGYLFPRPHNSLYFRVCFQHFGPDGIERLKAIVLNFVAKEVFRNNIAYQDLLAKVSSNASSEGLSRLISINPISASMFNPQSSVVNDKPKRRRHESSVGILASDENDIIKANHDNRDSEVYEEYDDVLLKKDEIII